MRASLSVQMDPDSLKASVSADGVYLMTVFPRLVLEFTREDVDVFYRKVLAELDEADAHRKVLDKMLLAPRTTKGAV